jgi:hypothetical protein
MPIKIRRGKMYVEACIDRQDHAVPRGGRAVQHGERRVDDAAPRDGRFTTRENSSA